MGEIHELFVLALSLVWFAGATPEKKYVIFLEINSPTFFGLCIVFLRRQYASICLHGPLQSSWNQHRLLPVVVSLKAMVHRAGQKGGITASQACLESPVVVSVP